MYIVLRRNDVWNCRVKRIPRKHVFSFVRNWSCNSARRGSFQRYVGFSLRSLREWKYKERLLFLNVTSVCLQLHFAHFVSAFAFSLYPFFFSLSLFFLTRPSPHSLTSLIRLIFFSPESSNVHQFRFKCRKRGWNEQGSTVTFPKQMDASAWSLFNTSRPSVSSLVHLRK